MRNVMKSPIVVVLVLAVLAFGGYYFYMKGSAPAAAPESEKMMEDKPAVEGEAMVKEFVMTAYYDAKGKWFSVKEMTVKKGDLVRVKVTNTAGMHDFVIDEFGVKKELPLNEEVVIEFVADKAGTFEYYCSKPGHRAGGQFGTLTVSE